MLKIASIEVLRQARDPVNEVRGWLAASYAHAGGLQEGCGQDVHNRRLPLTA